MVIGYAAGVFDLFHVGHLNILRQAKLRCDYLVAGIVCDELVEATKGYRPVIPTAERSEIVSNISFVDAVYTEISKDRIDTWNDVKFNIFFKGDDWKDTDKGRDLELRLGKVGVRVEYFPYTIHTSSTKLRRALDALVAPENLAEHA